MLIVTAIYGATVFVAATLACIACLVPGSTIVDTITNGFVSLMVRQLRLVLLLLLLSLLPMLVPLLLRFLLLSFDWCSYFFSY
jgi:hypothetical protein